MFARILYTLFETLWIATVGGHGKRELFVSPFLNSVSKIHNKVNKLINLLPKRQK